MELKYDIYLLNNAQGTGEKRQYVRIVQHEPMTEKQLQRKSRAAAHSPREMWLRCWQSFMTFWWKNSPWDDAFISRDRLLLHVG